MITQQWPEEMVDAINQLRHGYIVDTVYGPLQIMSTVELCERCGAPIVVLRNDDGIQNWYEIGFQWNDDDRALAHCWPHTPDDCTRERARRTP